MSEPSALFAKIHISKEKFAEFLKGKPAKPSIDDDLLAWWESRKMHSKSALTEKCFFENTLPTNEEVINSWKEEVETITFSDYDPVQELWIYAINLFSQNFLEILPTLIFLKSVESYKQANDDDFAMVFDYFWGDEGVMAYMAFPNNKFKLDSKIENTAELPQEQLEFAINYLDKKRAEFEDGGSDLL